MKEAPRKNALARAHLKRERLEARAAAAPSGETSERARERARGRRLLPLGGAQLREVEHALRVAPLVVVPGDDLAAGGGCRGEGWAGGESMRRAVRVDVAQ